jgi:Rrf2 family transcriptional regulator, iron-sulfur cluster assembly transcription factor
MLKINTKVRYGLMTLIELAKPENSEGVLQKDISINQKIQNKYLDKIIKTLKSKKLIENLKGKHSGYVLTRDPGKISVLDVYKAFEKELAIIDCLCDPDYCKRFKKCLVKDYWQSLNDTIENHLLKTSIYTLLNSTKKIKKKNNSLIKKVH